MKGQSLTKKLERITRNNYIKREDLMIFLENQDLLEIWQAKFPFDRDKYYFDTIIKFLVDHARL